jgi:glycosyltransferase involved in cell wall biosynthesis
MVLISVIIPALNEEKQLPRTLASLRRQKLDAEYELIVVDNGSTDQTAEIARAYGARVVIASERGVAYARQAGLEAARGVIVAQADADTEYPDDWLSRIKLHFSQNRQTVAVTGGYLYREPKRFERAEWGMRNLANWGSRLITGRLLMVSGANFSFNRKALMACGGYHPHSFSSDQYDVAARLSKLGSIAYDHKLVVVTSARRVDRPALSIAMIFMRFVMGLHLVIFKFFFVDQFRGWFRTGEVRTRTLNVMKATASMAITFAFTLLAIWFYFALFKLPVPISIPSP